MWCGICFRGLAEHSLHLPYSSNGEPCVVLDMLEFHPQVDELTAKVLRRRIIELSDPRQYVFVEPDSRVVDIDYPDFHCSNIAASGGSILFCKCCR